MSDAATFAMIIRTINTSLSSDMMPVFKDSIVAGCVDNPSDRLGYQNWLKFKHSLTMDVDVPIHNGIKLQDVVVTESPRALYIGNKKIEFDSVVACNIIQIYKIALMQNLTLLDVFRLGFHYGRWLHLSNTHPVRS
jgi:hypothetical protein